MGGVFWIRPVLQQHYLQARVDKSHEGAVCCSLSHEEWPMVFTHL